MRWPWQRKSDVLDDQLAWMKKSLALIGEHDPEAASRLARNIADRIAIAGRDASPMDRVVDVTEMVQAELGRQMAKLS